jgi:DNA topoisomerase IA
MGKYTLIITEKPDVAQKIASALDLEEKPRKIKRKGRTF